MVSTTTPLTPAEGAEIVTAIRSAEKRTGAEIFAVLSRRSGDYRLAALAFLLLQVFLVSFIIAALGQSLKVTSDFLYPIVVAVSAVTALLTPYLIKAADPLSAKAVTLVPARVSGLMGMYSNWLESLQPTGDRAELTRIIRRIQLIESPEQLGKSTVARDYTEKNNGGRTVYVSLGGGSRSGGKADFVWRLADVFEIPYSIKQREKELRIRHKLEACDLIIVDEAHLMWSWTARSVAEFLDYLRTDLHADGERGVVLIATNNDMMDGLRRFKAETRYNLGQLLGRMRLETMRIDPAEDVQPDDIRLLAARYYKPGARIVNLLTDLARRDGLGHFGLITDILNEAWATTKANRADLDDATVEGVAKRIMETLRQRKELYA
jgi:hypothetical protein